MQHDDIGLGLGLESEMVVELKEIPQTNWSICLTSRNREFFYCHSDQARNTWQVPDDILEIIGDLLNEALELEYNHIDHIDHMDGDEEGVNVQALEGARDDQDYGNHDHGVGNVDLDNNNEEKVSNSLSLKRSLAEHGQSAGNSSPTNQIPNEPAAKKIKAKSFQELEQDFNSLLEELKVSPFSTWDLESDKLQQHDRALALDPTDQKDLFEKWLQTASQKALEEKQAMDAMDPKTKYTLLLQEAITSTNWKSARFADFSRKYKNDVRFREFNPSVGKEKETLFEDRLKSLKLASRDAARKEFDEMLEEIFGSAKSISSESLSLANVVLRVEKEARYIAVKNGVERENRIKIYLNALKKR